jgi:CSLREA domain-containing protein
MATTGLLPGALNPSKVVDLLLRLALALALWLVATPPAQAATYTVNSTGDQADALVGDGNCLTAALTCTLRAAIQEANSNAAADIIHFNIAGGGVQTIVLTSALPTISRRVTIDGTTQPGWAVGSLTLRINAAGAGAANTLDLVAGSSNSTIRGLCIIQSGMAAIDINGSSTNTIAGNFLGTDPTGTAAGPGNGVGVSIISTSGSNIIGGTVAADRNIISSNTVDGIQINGSGAGAVNNLVEGNYIGLNVTGTAALGNTNQGVAVFGTSTNNTIGGTAAGAGNVVSGNGNRGIQVGVAGAGGIVIQGNKVGTNAAGTAGIPNGAAGVVLGSASHTVGGTVANAGNLIAFNTGAGVEVLNAAGINNAIEGNAIYSNGGLGIDLNNDGVTANDALDADTGPNNLQNYPVLTAAMTDGLGTFCNIAGSLDSAASTTYRIELFASTAADPSGFGEGQRYLGTTNVTTNAAGTVTFGLTLAANLAAGEFVTATATDPANNTSEFGPALLAYGVLIVTTNTDVVDGTVTSVNNLIANPGADGRISLREAIQATNATAGLNAIRFGIPPAGAKTILLSGALAPLTKFTSPVIVDGTTQPGWVNAAPFAPIIEINATNNGATAVLDLQPGTTGSTIRGFVINRCPGDGIHLNTSTNVVAGNFIGTNLAGTAAGGGNGNGIVISAPGVTAANNNIIGGTTAADRNVISGNTVDGIQINGGAGGDANNVVEGNYIGLDVNGTAAVANGGQGISIFGTNTNNTIGGTAAGAGNVISGNTGQGIRIHDATTTGTIVQGNKIGTDPAGTVARANAGGGLRIYNSSTGNMIGGTTAGAGNVIAFNTVDGIQLPVAPLATGCGSGCASILGNSIFSNGSTTAHLGIDLNDNGAAVNGVNNGVTNNDAGDVDAGPNDLLNFPVITSASVSGGNVTVNFNTDLVAGSSYRIEFFNSASHWDAGRHGEGQTFVGTRNVTGGAGSWGVTFPGAQGDFLTATTTRCTDGAICAAFGSTSEFSAAFIVTTAVTLMSFTATARDGSVDLNWQTGSEINNLGFNLYRSLSAAGPFTRITASLIPGLGNSPEGRSYSYHDAGLVNGTTCFYQLEDVETTGRTQMHGPVSATPSTGKGTPTATPTATPTTTATPTPGPTLAPRLTPTSGPRLTPTSGPTSAPTPTPGSGSGSSSRVSYGNPSVSFRILERTDRDALVELRTGGFFATSLADGTVRVEVPSLREAASPGQTNVPVLRTWIEAVAGRKAKISDVHPDDVQSFSLRPEDALQPEVEVSADSMIKLVRHRAQKHGGLAPFPEAWAQILTTAFQGDVKKAQLEMAPLRYDAGSGKLFLARTLTARITFDGREPGEVSLGGARGRMMPPARVSQGVFARLAVTNAGLYAASFEDLFGRGGRSLPASSIGLARQGASVPFHLEPNTGWFGPGSTLFFVSAGAALNPYGTEAVYELVQTSAPTAPMPSSSAPPAGNVLASYLEDSRSEVNSLYQAALLDAPDLWLWDYIVSPATKVYPFTLSLPGSLGVARLTVDFQGGSDFDANPDHHLRVSVNGNLVGEGSWDGKEPYTVTADVASTLLRDGANELEIQNVGDTAAAYSLVMLNRFSLRYPRALVAEGGRFEGTFESSGTAVVAGLAPPMLNATGAIGATLREPSGAATAPYLLDVTDATPRWLTGAALKARGLTFSVEAGHRYLATTSALKPRVTAAPAAALHSTLNQADYLLITPREFLVAAQPLLDYRHAEGLSVRAVAVEDIYDEFGGGEVGPAAIHDFIAYAYHQWTSPSPRYVLLLGDTTYDPKDYLHTGIKDRIPSITVKTSFLWTVSDPALAAVNGDDLIPDLAIGRLSASNLQEAQLLVGKVIAFENAAFPLSGPRVLVADNADDGGNFEQSADEIDTDILGGNAQKIYLSQLGGGTRPAIYAALNGGASLVSYIGHGSTVVWASENVFNNTDLPNLAPQAQQPLLFTMDCLNGYFQIPGLNSLAEAFVKADGRGAIAAFAPSGLSVHDDANIYHRALLQELLSGRHQRLGDAILAAQVDYANSGAMPELLSIYHLLGDPALALR